MSKVVKLWSVVGKILPTAIRTLPGNQRQRFLSASTGPSLLPSSRLAVIDGAGHTPQSERPDEFNRAVGDFLAR